MFRLFCFIQAGVSQLSVRSCCHQIRQSCGCRMHWAASVTTWWLIRIWSVWMTPARHWIFASIFVCAARPFFRSNLQLTSGRPDCMYAYDELDQSIVEQRSAEFRAQVERRLAGKISEAEFKPLRLMNGLYLQLHASRLPTYWMT